MSSSSTEGCFPSETPTTTDERTCRWVHVKNLVKHEDQGTLTPAKRKGLYRKSNQVIAALIRAGLPEHQVTIPWRGIGKGLAEIEEEQQIKKRCVEGCVLANVNHNPKQPSVDEVLRYLGIATRAKGVGLP